ncbi:MAG: antitoxin [Deltaproteobacteria bacterium]
MRTTLTLDPDVAKLLEDEMHRSRKTFKQTVNDAIRRGLSSGLRPTVSPPYRIKPHLASLAAGLDSERMNSLVDELEDAAVLAKARPSRAARAARAAERRR